MLHLFLWLMIDIQTIIIAKKRYYPLNCNNRPIVLNIKKSDFNTDTLFITWGMQ